MPLFWQTQSLLQRHTEVLRKPNASIAPLLVAMHNRVVVILNTQGTEKLADVLLPCSTFLRPKYFQKHHDGFGEARNTLSGAGYMQFWDGETLCSSAFCCSMGEYLTPLLSQLCFGENLGIFTCFAIFMIPYWSNDSLPFSEKNLITAMNRGFSMGLHTLSPYQTHGNSIPHIQKLWVYHQQLYN